MKFGLVFKILLLKIKSLIQLFLKANILIVFFIMIIPISGIGQAVEPGKVITEDAEIVSVDSVNFKKHSPHKATIYSLVLPGLGQAYNKKYWKIPIIYAGFGAFYYFISLNDKEYRKYREAYYHSITGDPTDPPVNDYEEKYDSDFLLSSKNYYRRNRDLTYILTGVWYLLNVVDAAVDAHLFTWEVDENLSLRIEPAVYQPLYGYRPNGGVKLTMRFK